MQGYALITYTAKAVMPCHAGRGFHTVQGTGSIHGRAVIGNEEDGEVHCVSEVYCESEACAIKAQVMS